MSDQIAVQQEEVTIYTPTLDGLEVLNKTVTMYSNMLQESKPFVMGALTQGHAMGVTNPFKAISMFWPMNGKASLKTDALQYHLLEKGFIVEPFKVIENCKPLYKYYDKQLVDQVLAKHAKEFFQNFLSSKTKLTIEQLLLKLKANMLYSESNPDLAKLGLEGRTKKPYDWVTILEATTRSRNGQTHKTQHEFRFSTAHERGIPYTNFKAVKEGKEAEYKWKGPWIGRSTMMYKRCASELANIVAPGSAYGSEGLDGYIDVKVHERESDLFKKEHGRPQTVEDVTEEATIIQ